MKSLKLLNTRAAKIYILLLAGAAVNTISCNRDLLDKKPLDKLTDDAVFSDATFLQNYVYNVYNGMKPIWYPGTGGFETLTDIAVSQPETHDKAAGIRQYIQGTISPDNITDLTNIWNEEYGYIRKANVFFEKTTTSSFDATVLDPMKGQMHFLRAWMYFELIKTFGGVPIITKSYKLDDTNFDTPRNTYDECVKFILDECDQATTLLKDVAPASGKITKAAAMALKARVLLYAASPLNNPSNDKTKWQAAEVATKAVLDLSFTLHPTHDDLFTRPVKTDEIILGKSFTPGTRVPDWGFNYDYWPSGFDARQRIMPTQTFVNMFQMTNGQYPYLADGVTVNPTSGYDPQHPNVNRDPRYYSDIIFPGAGPFTINDGAKSTVRTYEYWEDANPNPDNAGPYANPNKVDPKNGQTLYDFGRDSKTYWVKGFTPFHWRVQTGYTFRRLCDFNGPRASFDYDYSQAIVFLRLAEFYLNYAEIEIALGNEAVARDYINKVRKRPSVNMPNITSAGTDLVRDYRNERAIELHLEDHRFFDLMRWKAAPGNIDIPIRGLTSVKMDWTGAQAGDLLGKLSYTYGVIDAAEVRAPWKGDYYYLLPIPREEIKKSHNAIKQNPGYQ
ncbi:RagB/SusD family nutrient uptake outer membrane protein [Chitinophaga eiseniae]|uniref:RagB/SusD family nutrient uptake outer membrane protein n=1 Tax=Chitinophaga eiseniae TaxID=634771 RepID=A0A847SS69_9BACT|nr:RagB/SusD family nutrient uptake outer membrane protein [Chitinophaga eiseniae]NLR80868.1 RagB/SusD family nutrient uptake outer membrane protein [Chitinophaga eiseniae]